MKNDMLQSINDKFINDKTAKRAQSKIERKEFNPRVPIESVVVDSSVIGDLNNEKTSDTFFKSKYNFESTNQGNVKDVSLFRLNGYKDVPAFGEFIQGNNATAPTSTITNESIPNPTGNLLNSGVTRKDIPNPEQTFISQDNRTDKERQDAQDYYNEVMNPNLLEQAYSAVRMIPRAIADPIQGVGEIINAVAPDSHIARDLGNFQDEEFEYRKRNLDPGTSNMDKFMANVGEGSNVTAWAMANVLPVEAMIGGGLGKAKSFLNSTDDIAKNVVTKTPVKTQVVPEKFIITEPTTNTLQLKSTMMGGPFEKQLSKTGELNINNIKAHIAKSETSLADKYIIDKVLNEKFAGKTSINYNEFRKAVSDELIPLNKEFTNTYAEYGTDRLGYHESNDFLKNETILFSNEAKLGKGNATHFEKNTLGHSRILISNQEPEIMHVLESQSDYFQKGGVSNSEILANKTNQHYNEMASETISMYENAYFDKSTNKYLIEPGDGEPFVLTKQERDSAIKRLNDNILNRPTNKNIEQKQFLGDKHQERLLQENVAYAAENGQTKVRYPTYETAAKIEGFEKGKPTQEFINSQIEFRQNMIDIMDKFGSTSDEFKKINDEYSQLLKDNSTGGYSSEHQTILNKYDKAPKMIKKTIGQEVRTVTDHLGNTWYEFDIPKPYLEGKAEIKALGLGPAGIGLGAAAVGNEITE